MDESSVSFEGNNLFFNTVLVELDYPIKDVRVVNDLAIVLFEYDNYDGSGQFNNLLAINERGEQVWTAEHPTNATSDTYVEFLSAHPLKLWNFAGYVCTIDPDSGKIQAFIFAK